MSIRNDEFSKCTAVEVEVLSTIEEINGRWTCTSCDYEWSGVMGDAEVPELCECQRGY